MQLPTKEHELKQFLASLPGDKAATLAVAVERDRLQGKPGMPADLILDGLRPVLRASSARRVPIPQRLVCEPFADFLVNDPRDFKQAGRISRSSIRALWRWLAKDGLRVTLAELESQIAHAILQRELQLQADLVARAAIGNRRRVRMASGRSGEAADRAAHARPSSSAARMR